MSNHLLESILHNRLVDAQEMFYNKMEIIKEQKLHEVKRNIASQMNEALGDTERKKKSSMSPEERTRAKTRQYQSFLQKHKDDPRVMSRMFRATASDIGKVFKKDPIRVTGKLGAAAVSKAHDVVSKAIDKKDSDGKPVKAGFKDILLHVAKNIEASKT